MRKIEEIKQGLEDLTLKEDEFIEFKTSMPRDYKQIARHFIGIANNGGGYYIVGVKETNEGIELVGVKQKDFSFIKDQFISICRENTINVRCDVHIVNINKLEIIIVEIKNSGTNAYFKSENPIVYFRDSSGKTYSPRYEKVFKYMSLEAFILSLYNGNWMFCEPSKWNDNFESRFYCAKFSSDKSIYAPKLFATCVTRKQNNEAAWKVYAHGHGLGSHCVQLELDVIKLRDELRKSDSMYEFVEKKVKYERENYILNLHDRKKTEYQNYFNPFSINAFINLLSLKRDAYEYEDEVRFFAIPREKTFDRNRHKKASVIKLPVLWKNVIRRVRIDKSCSEAEIISIRQACFYAGINPVFKNCLYSNPLSPDSSHIKIDFELFCIDDIPQSSARITIL